MKVEASVNSFTPAGAVPTHTRAESDTAPAVEDYRSDRLILEELSAEVARLHRRLDVLEPYLPLLHRWSALSRVFGGLHRG